MCVCTCLELPDECDRVCSREYMPVCASDRITYPNKCIYNTAQCKVRKLVSRVIINELRSKPKILSSTKRNKAKCLEWPESTISHGSRFYIFYIYAIAQLFCHKIKHGRCHGKNVNNLCRPPLPQSRSPLLSFSAHPASS